MARDRLAAMRAQQNKQANGSGSDSYGDPPSAPSLRAGTPRDPFTSGSASEEGSRPSNASSGRRLPPAGGQPSRPRQPPVGGSYAQDLTDEKGSSYYNDAPAPRARAAPGTRPRAPPIVDPFADTNGDMEMSERQTANRGTPAQFRAARPGEAPRQVSSTADFFSAIQAMQDDLRELNSMIDGMSELQKRSLDVPSDDSASARVKNSVESLAADIRSASARLKQRIQGFEADHSLLRQRGDPDGNLSARQQQLAALKSRFVEAVQKYAGVEQAQRRAVKAKVERQVRIVKPDATDEEISAAFEDEQSGGAQVFQQALASSQRTGAARNALREVQSRGEDIKRIEKTITELAQLFNDMTIMVEEQDVMVQHIEQKAVEVNTETEAAGLHLTKGVQSAKAARKKRKCCFIVFFLILVAAGVVVAVLIVSKNNGGSTSKPAAAAATAGAKMLVVLD